jgi:hypothetical protein
MWLDSTEDLLRCSDTLTERSVSFSHLKISIELSITYVTVKTQEAVERYEAEARETAGAEIPQWTGLIGSQIEQFRRRGTLASRQLVGQHHRLQGHSYE